MQLGRHRRPELIVLHIVMAIFSEKMPMGATIPDGRIQGTFQLYLIWQKFIPHIAVVIAA